MIINLKSTSSMMWNNVVYLRKYHIIEMINYYEAESLYQARLAARKLAFDYDKRYKYSIYYSGLNFYYTPEGEYINTSIGLSKNNIQRFTPMQWYWNSNIIINFN
jgi:hypothetical protein